MKKSLIALAALSAFATAAQAQSSVTVYGLIDMGYTAGTNTHTTAAGVSTDRKFSSTGNGDGALATSRLGVRGTEDLGGGLKANFVLEYDLIDVGTGGNGQTNAATTTNGAADFNGTAAAAAAGFGARYSWVGLEDAKLGQLRLGRQEQSIHSVMVGGSAGAANNVTGAIYSAGLGDVSTNQASVRPHNVFVNRAVTYISPAFNGFRVELQTASQELETVGTAPTQASENGGSLKYSAGKLSAAYAIAVSSTSGSAILAAKSEQQAIAASYDFGVARLFALSTDRKNTNAGALFNHTKATELGVQVPRGKVTLWASAYEGDRAGSDNTSTAVASAAAAANLVNFSKASGDISGYQVGARYDLSKRTALYGIYGKQEVKANTGAASGAKIESDAMALGVRHSF